MDKHISRRVVDTCVRTRAELHLLHCGTIIMRSPRAKPQSGAAEFYGDRVCSGSFSSRPRGFSCPLFARLVGRFSGSQSCAAGFGHYVCLRPGGGSDGNVYNVLRGSKDSWGSCGA